MSLYTKYRPKDWDSVIGQEYITKILRNSIKSGRVSHAYLFHGSRGTGKTTSARILAKAINCTDVREWNPCHACANCLAFDNETMLDIIEIDAASNTGVDNIRELIERARFEPNQGKYKVYIIDEVHMLSTGAFNALLKTLEEPPAHVKFILATTEIEKVPETIRSRTLRFDFRKIGLEDIIGRLEYVCKAEGIKADGEALRIIAKSARGWLRDALTLLEQNVIDSEVSTEHVRYTLSLVEESLIEGCIEALARADVKTTVTIISTLQERHIQVRSFFDQMMYRLRDLMVEHLDDDKFTLYSSLMLSFEEAYGKIRVIGDGMMLIELTLLRIAKRSAGEDFIWWTAQRTESVMRSHTSQKTEKKEEGVSEKIQSVPELSPKKEEAPRETSEFPPRVVWVEVSSKNDVSSFSYPRLINHLKWQNPALGADLKTSRFTEESGVLTLIFSKKWNHDRVNTAKVRNIIAESCQELFSGDWEVRCEFREWALAGNITEWVF